MAVQGKHLTMAAVVTIVSVAAGVGSIYRFLIVPSLVKVEQERVKTHEWRHSVRHRLILLENPTLTDEQRVTLKAVLTGSTRK